MAIMKVQKTHDRTIAIVQTTVPSGQEARTLAALILEKRLGACVQFMRIKSCYHWRGKKESANELLVLIKTRRSLTAKLIDFIKKHHSYEVPEIIVTPVKAANPGYAEWVFQETK